MSQGTLHQMNEVHVHEAVKLHIEKCKERERVITKRGQFKGRSIMTVINPLSA